MDDPDLTEAIEAALARNPARVQRIVHHGRAIWIKRPERLSALRRLQKGDARGGFEAERAGLHALAAAGAPVPRILQEGPGYMAIEDAGAPLSVILRAEGGKFEGRTAILEAAGRALAGLHLAGLTHGRPAPRDICWDGARIRFIDPERYAPARNTAAGHAQDVLLFALGAHTVTQERRFEIDAALAAYRGAAGPALWQAVQARARWLPLLDRLTRPLQLRRPGKAKEFKAIPLTRAALGEA